MAALLHPWRCDLSNSTCSVPCCAMCELRCFFVPKETPHSPHWSSSGPPRDRHSTQPLHGSNRASDDAPRVSAWFRNFANTRCMHGSLCAKSTYMCNVVVITVRTLHVLVEQRLKQFTRTNSALDFPCNTKAYVTAARSDNCVVRGCLSLSC